MKRIALPGLIALDVTLIGTLLALHFTLHAAWQTPLGIDNLPSPDAMEHVGVAESLLRHGIPAIELADGTLLPSRYQIGYPAAISLWMAVTGGGQTSALTLNLLLGALILVFTYGLGVLIQGRSLGFVAGLITLLSPGLFTICEVLMSEPLAVALFLLASILALRRVRRGGAVSAIAVGFVIGAMCAVRLTHVLALVHLVPLALLVRRRHRWKEFLWGMVGFLPWVVGIAGLHWWLNGHPLVQGYELWAPQSLAIGEGWSFAHFFSGEIPLASRLRDELYAPHWQTIPSMLLGFPPKYEPALLLYPWPLVVGWICFLSEGHRRLRRRWAWSLLLTLAVYFVVWGTYYFWAPRFFFPLVPSLIVLGVAGLMPRASRGRGSNTLRGALLMLAMGQQTVALSWNFPHGVSMRESERLALGRLDERIPDNAVVVSDSFSILARDVLEHDDRWFFSWSAAGHDLLLRESLTHGVPVLREGNGRPSVISDGTRIRPESETLLRALHREGRSVWLIFLNRALRREGPDRRLRDLGLPRTPNGPTNTVLSVWWWPASLEATAQALSPEVRGANPAGWTNTTPLSGERLDLPIH